MTARFPVLLLAGCLLGVAAPVLAAEEPDPAGFDWDLRRVPFSRAGSYFAFSHQGKAGARPEGLFLRTVRANTRHESIFVVEMLDHGKVVPFVEKPSPARMVLEAGAARAEIVFAEPNVLRFRTHGATLRLRMWTVPPVNSAYPGEGNRWVVNNSPNGVKLMLTPLSGKLSVDAPWNGIHSERIVIDIEPAAEGWGELVVEEYRSAWRKRDYSGDFAAAVAAVDRAWRDWLAGMPAGPDPYRAANRLSAYLMWSSLVAPEGYFKRPAMFMSKNNMAGVWTWDHCFNAMALGYKNPQAAWDQLMVMIDLIDENGGLPDRVLDRAITWTHNKPPVHGWTLAMLLKRNPWFANPARLREIYGPLSRMTDWWFTFRDDDRDGLPQYNHGNDSGWDNATPFVDGVPLETPDLSAFLVIQMDVLSDVARRLGKTADAKRWKQRSDALLDKLLKTFWRDDRFVTYRSGNDAELSRESQSLFLFLPLLLGERLPPVIRQKLVERLHEPGRHLTDHGLATESPKSKLYQRDGYWRGPIWAPSTLILVEGLRAAQDGAFARDIAKRFCDMAQTSTMPENFDALSGGELRDRGYTWTAAVFAILAHEYLGN